jgi:hypothetical protein
VVGVAGVLWWAAPSCTNGDGRVDTVVLHDGLLGADDRPVGDRLRERGRSVEWRAGDDACAAVEAWLPAATAQIAVVIVAGDGLGQCGSLAQVANAQKLILLPPPGDQIGAPPGARVIDATWAVGAADTKSMPCWWMDIDCGAEGVVMRNDGALSDAALDRLGRIIAAELP